MPGFKAKGNQQCGPEHSLVFPERKVFGIANVRSAPVVGWRIILKLEEGSTIEVHLATAELTRRVEMNAYRKAKRLQEADGSGIRRCPDKSLRARLNPAMETYEFRGKDGTAAGTC